VLPPRFDRALATVTESAAASLPTAERAEAVLEALRGVVDFDCAALSFFDAAEKRLRTLAQLDYPDGFDEATGAPEYRAEHERLRMLRPGRPLRFSDLPDGGATTFTATELAWPLGLRGGLGMALYARDGRETGFFSLNTVAADRPTDRDRDVVAALAGVLGEVADAVGRFSLGLGYGHVLLSATGSVLRLPGGDGRGVLDVDAEPLVFARHLAATGGWPAAFLWSDAPRARWHRIELSGSAEGEVVGYPVVVSATDVGRPYELTPRELEVLTLVARGCSNREIAETLVVATGTVRVHVERVLAKLGARSRAEAAARAAAEGLVVWIDGKPPLTAQRYVG
jgi:DNA-binding CsgD family transcriptional regulator